MKLSGTGRSELLELIVHLRGEIIILSGLYEDLKKCHDAYLRNLTATQARCTELLIENRRLQGYEL